MAIQQSKKQSDLEKRLQLLRRQVYGKGEKIQNPEFKIPSQTNITAGYQLPAINSSSDLTFLHQDLLKILLFASLAIGAETFFYLLVKNNVLTLNFF